MSLLFSDAAMFLIVNGILSVFISALITWNRQKYFFDEQNKKYEERQKDADQKRKDFMLKAFLQETNFNLILTNPNTNTEYFKILFDTRCYTLFKSEIALLRNDVVNKVNNVYSQLFQNNAKLEARFFGIPQLQWNFVENIYRELKIPLEEFKTFLEAR